MNSLIHAVSSVGRATNSGLHQIDLIGLTVVRYPFLGVGRKFESCTATNVLNRSLYYKISLFDFL
jgi:hypothetical protein